MSNQVSFTKATKDWAKFLFDVEKCPFIGTKSTGKNGEPYGDLCFKPSMQNYMQEIGWILQEYRCGFFNGTDGSCTNGVHCKFGHEYSPRWIKSKPRRNFVSAYQASPSVNTSDEKSVVSTDTEITISQPSRSVCLDSPTPDSWSSVVFSSSIEAPVFSVDPEIKKWQKRLFNVEQTLKELREDPDFDEESSFDAIQQGINAIEKAKRKISALRKAKADKKAKENFSWADDESSDDES